MRERLDLLTKHQLSNGEEIRQNTVAANTQAHRHERALSNQLDRIHNANRESRPHIAKCKSDTTAVDGRANIQVIMSSRRAAL